MSTLRRSPRLAAKANTSTAPVITPHTDDQPVNIASIIEKECINRGDTYFDGLVTEFNDWLSTAHRAYTHYFDNKDNQWKPYKLSFIVEEWTRHHSNSIWKQRHMKEYTPQIILYCNKNNIKYDPTMPANFIEWFYMPHNQLPLPLCLDAWFKSLAL